MVNNRNINNFLVLLLRRYDCISKIWLIGSRADGLNVKPTSDWDFLIFTKEDLISLLIKDTELSKKAKLNNIDLLVEKEGKFFSSPWENKRISVDELKWSVVSGNIARYWGNKCRQRTPEDYLTDYEKYAIAHGADDCIEISGWKTARLIYPSEGVGSLASPFKGETTLG